MPQGDGRFVADEFLKLYLLAMTRPLRIGLRTLAFILVGFLIVSLALFFIVRSVPFKDWLQTMLSERSGFDVRVRSLRMQLPLDIVAESVEVSKLGVLFFAANRLTAAITPFDMLRSTFHRVDVENPVLQLDLDDILKSSAKRSPTIALRLVNVRNGAIVLKKAGATIFELPKINLTAENLNLGGQAEINLRADIAQLNGEAELRVTGEARNLAAEIVVQPKQTVYARKEVKDAVPELLSLQAKLHASENQSAEATVEGRMHNLKLGDASLTGALAARVAIDPGWTTATFSGRATLMDFPKAIYSTVRQLPNGTAAADFAGAFALVSKTLSVRSIELSSPLGNGTGEGEIAFAPQTRISHANLKLREIPLEPLKALLPAPFNQWSYRGLGRLELDLRGAFEALEMTGVAHSDTLQIGGETVQIANLTFAVPFEWNKPTLHIRDAKMSGVKLVYGAKERWQGVVERVQASASLDVQANEALKIAGEFTANGGKFSSPDSSKVGENLSLGGPYEITFVPAKTALSVRGKWRAEAGEILWDKFFAELGSRKPALDVNLDYLRAENRLDCHPCHLNLAQVGDLDLSGSIARLTDSPELRLQVQSRNFLPGGFFDFALRDTLKRQYPFLERLLVQGQMTFQLKVEGGLDALAVGGELSLKAGELRGKANNWQIGPIALDLPFQIQLPKKSAGSAADLRRGKLMIAKAAFGDQSLGAISATVSLANNALRFHEPIRFTIFGGEIDVGDLYWPDVIAAPTGLSFSAAAKTVQLEQLTQTFNWHPFRGTLSGSIPEVRSEGDTLRASGEILAQVFGGRARIGKLEIENPFSSLASIKLDARLDGIQLEQLSHTFEFGRISGILEGNIDDLVITANQPSQFHADLHSVDRGAEQRISVDALNKVTVLSSGESAGALYGGLAGLFDSFRYSKLGFKADLKNDRLTLRGVESRGDQEFLVVGSILPPTVNVISHTQQIAFSELLRRLDRIKADQTKPQ